MLGTTKRSPIREEIAALRFASFAMTLFSWTRIDIKNAKSYIRVYRRSSVCYFCILGVLWSRGWIGLTTLKYLFLVAEDGDSSKDITRILQFRYLTSWTTWL